MAGIKGRPNRGKYRSPYDGKPPRYTGPHWIGKAIKAPPIEAGPNWIGQRIPFRHLTHASRNGG